MVFDMVIIRTSAINGSMSLGGGGNLVSTFGLNPEWLCFFGSGSLQLGIVLWEMWAVPCLLIHVALVPGIHLTAEEIHTASV
jgi:hypothetical protein